MDLGRKGFGKSTRKLEGDVFNYDNKEGLHTDSISWLPSNI